MIQPGHRKDDRPTSHLWKSPRYLPYPELLFPRFQRHPWRKDTPRDAYTAASFKMKPNPNRFRVPVVNPTSRQYGQDNTATGYKDREHQSARVTALLTREDGKVYGAVIKFRKEDREGRSNNNHSSGARFTVPWRVHNPKLQYLMKFIHFFRCFFFFLKTKELQQKRILHQVINLFFNKVFFLTDSLFNF